MEGRAIKFIVLDEVHERNIKCDSIIMLLKHRAVRGGQQKLILMSATAQVDKFSAFFKGTLTVTVPGRNHQVKIYHLEDIIER
jgi:HrpA-like RNA helicase